MCKMRFDKSDKHLKALYLFLFRLGSDNLNKYLPKVQIL